MLRLARAIALAGLTISSPDVGLAQEPPARPAPRTVVVRAGWLFDGGADNHRPDMTIVIEAGRIKVVGPRAEVAIPDGAEVIDLAESWVLPGLIDCHTHLGSRADRYDPIYRFRD